MSKEIKKKKFSLKIRKALCRELIRQIEACHKVHSMTYDDIFEVLSELSISYISSISDDQKSISHATAYFASKLIIDSGTLVMTMVPFDAVAH